MPTTKGSTGAARSSSTFSETSRTNFSSSTTYSLKPPGQVGRTDGAGTYAREHLTITRRRLVGLADEKFSVEYLCGSHRSPSARMAWLRTAGRPGRGRRAALRAGTTGPRALTAIRAVGAVHPATEDPKVVRACDD
jgi:hypothetical protein